MTDKPDPRYVDRAIEDANLLDRLKLAHSRDVELAKEKTKQNKIRARENRHVRTINYLNSEFGRVLVGWVVAVFCVLILMFGAAKIFGWGQHHTKTPDELKQDRYSNCVGSEWSGRTDNVWFPEAQGGQGLCLPKGQNPPEK